MSVLVVGSIALDTVTTPFGKARKVLGGSASYFSVSAGYFAPVRLVAVIGQDFPKRYINFFRKKSIDTAGLSIMKGKTFAWEGEYDWSFSDPRTIATHLNVFADFKPVIPRAYRNTKYIFLANIDPQIQLDILGQISRPYLVACDTMNYWIQHKPSVLDKLVKRVDVFLLNESEAKQLTGEPNLARAGKSLVRRGPRVVIIKKGEHGVLLFTGNRIFVAPAFLLESIVDPTGAGDTFAGGFIGYLARCRRSSFECIRQAVIYGSVMATFTVEDFSLNGLARVTQKAISQRLRQFRRFTAY